MASRSRVEFDEREYIREDPRRAPVRDFDDVEIRVRERSRERVNDRLPAFMRDDHRRPQGGGQMVLRQREIETVEQRARPRSPSPVRVTQRIIERTRSVSPPPRRIEDDVRFRRVVRESSRGPGPDRIRFVASRSRSPSEEVRERIRIIEKERAPSPVRVQRPPTPKVVKGPTIEREVITHYRDIDHGIVAAHPPSPLPARRTHRDTEIDIYTSHNETEVDIHKHSHSHSRGRSVSRERVLRRPVQAWDDEQVYLDINRKHLHVDIDRRQSLSRGRPRAHSAAPPMTDYDREEAREITSKIDARGRMGEAWHGMTKDWAIVDVPPGTERVRMDGAGGASAEVTWQKYSGVRRTRFIPEREEKGSAVSSTTSVTDLRPAPAERERRLSVQIVDKGGRGVSRERGLEIEKVTDRRLSIRASTPPPTRRSETWTEITKDLVCREAIEELNYEFEETEFFYYVVEYLSH
ncbi:hypothetical protein C8A05DRAFT_18186, partial [Staphylotrichum tortipilum]